MKTQTELYYWAFLLLWIAASIAMGRFFSKSKDARLKRKLYPVFLIGMIAAVAVPLALKSTKPFVLYFWISWWLFGIWFGLRTTRFCEMCGATFLTWPIKVKRKCTRCVPHE